MKTRFILILSLFFTIQNYGQCTVPPPPGYDIIFSLDPDNDGFASFDIAYYIQNFSTPLMESIYNVSASGYNTVFYNSNNQVSALQYTNLVVDEFCDINYEYSGTGPTFDPQPPCYWPVFTNLSVKLVTVPNNLDMDGDGILNVDEDTNHNLNLMDDDDDNDGIINLRDSSNTLSLNNHTNLKISVYPNPAGNGFVTFESNAIVSAVTIFDLSGKQLQEGQINGNVLPVNQLANGIYFFKFQSDQGAVLKKIVINK